MTSITSFLIMALLVELTPGPNMAWLALTAARGGRRAGWWALLGISAGLSIVGCAAALGLSGLADSSPFTFEILRLAGVGYMLWLAWQTWREGAENAPSRTGDGPSVRPLRDALAINLLNPKALTFFVAVLPGFVSETAPLRPQLLFLTLLYVAVATAIHAVIVVAGAAAHGWLQDRDRSRIIGRVFAILIAAVAIWMLFATARPADS